MGGSREPTYDGPGYRSLFVVVHLGRVRRCFGQSIEMSTERVDRPRRGMVDDFKQPGPALLKVREGDRVKFKLTSSWESYAVPGIEVAVPAPRLDDSHFRVVVGFEWRWLLRFTTAELTEVAGPMPTTLIGRDGQPIDGLRRRRRQISGQSPQSGDRSADR